MFGPIMDLGAIEHAISAIDPSALVDTDTSTHTLRVAASVDAGQLVALMGQAGYPIGLGEVVQAPSVCCSGCSG
jgi:hypothetical protein